MDDYYMYNRAFQANHSWAEPDFAKPGVEFVEGLEHRDYVFGVREMRLRGNIVFDDKIKCSVSWQKKDAGRIPEALWLEAQFHVENVYCWEMKKIGRLLSPLRVVRGGGRELPDMKKGFDMKQRRCLEVCKDCRGTFFTWNIFLKI